MEKVRPWCGQPSDRGRLRNRNRNILALLHATSYAYTAATHDAIIIVSSCYVIAAGAPLTIPVSCVCDSSLRHINPGNRNTACGVFTGIHMALAYEVLRYGPLSDETTLINTFPETESTTPSPTVHPFHCIQIQSKWHAGSKNT